MLKTTTRAIVAFALPLLLVLASPASASDLKVANAWVDLPAAYQNPSAYFVIQNKGSRARKIVGASSLRCDWIEIRRAVVKEGVMASKKIEEMEIPAGGAVAFVPRGLSLTLVGLGPVEAGDVIEIELALGDGEKLPIQAVVRAPEAAQPSDASKPAR